MTPEPAPVRPAVVPGTRPAPPSRTEIHPMPYTSSGRTPGENAPASGQPAPPPEIEAGVPLLEPPGWAVAQRSLFDLLDHAWRRFARDFTGPDGRLNYSGPLTTRDGVDDFYEVFF